MMPAPFEDDLLWQAEGQEITNPVPPEPRVRPKAREVDRIEGDVVAGEQLLRPAPRIIVDPDEAVRAGKDAAVMKERKILEAELPRHGFKQKPQFLGTGAAIGLFREEIGKA
jgi:hypothetical protein